MAAANADDYAQKRLGTYFPASANSLADGEFTGQCVSLVKWFIGEMARVADPGRARGNAKDFGDELVREGLATVVPTPQRGDVVVWKNDGGGYGHIGIVLSGNRVFEENINVAGVKSETVDGQTVHASRIGLLSESWRKGPATYYRLTGYKEVDMATPADINIAFMVGFNRPASDAEKNNKDYQNTTLLLQTIFNNNLEFRTKAANFDALQAQYNEVKKQLADAQTATAPAPVSATELAPGTYIVK